MRFKCSVCDGFGWIWHCDLDFHEDVSYITDNTKYICKSCAGEGYFNPFLSFDYILWLKCFIKDHQDYLNIIEGHYADYIILHWENKV